MMSRNERLWMIALCLCVVVPQVLLRHWWVEDAAIAFAYARNIANGDGVVPFVGGERVEGYSDPLWVGLLTLGQVVGLDPFVVSKVLGGLFAAGAIPLAWKIATYLPIPDEPAWLRRAVPWLAAALVAGNGQHLVWAAAGLESPLFCCLLALGTWRVLREADVGGAPWSAVAFLLAALTRPEGVMYAALGLAVGAWADVGSGRHRRVVATFLTFSVPYLLWHAATWAYFALPFPLPYYAKLADEPFTPWNWNARAWTYLRNWAWEGWGWLLPVLALGVAGTRGRRPVIALGSLALLALVLVPAVPTGVKVVLMAAAWLLTPILPLGRSKAVALCAGMLALNLAFALRAGGDWMHGYRWFSFCVVPLVAIYAAGVAEISARSRRLAGAVFVTLAAIPLVANLAWAGAYFRHPEPMTPSTTRPRVTLFDKYAERIGLDRPWVLFDHTMGGLMWWAPPSRAVDFYGLTDVTFALQRPKKGFTNRWIAASHLDFAHVKGTLPRQKVFKEMFVQLPKGGGKNADNYIHRGLLTTPAWPTPETGFSLDVGHRIEGFAVRSPEVAPGGGLYLELGLSRLRWSVDPFTVQVFLSGPTTVQFAARAGYGEIFPPKLWKPREIFDGRYAFPLPSDLPEGTYDLGFVVRTSDGWAEQPLEVPAGATMRTDDAVIAPGEVVFPGAVTVKSSVEGEAEADWQRALTAASAGDCTTAESAWKDALSHRPTEPAWRDELEARAATPLSTCWAGKSRLLGDISARVSALRSARRWDPRSDAANEAGRAVGDEVWPQAMAARDRGDHATAFALFDAIVTADPPRSWARKYAEDARSGLLARVE